MEYERVTSDDVSVGLEGRMPSWHSEAVDAVRDVVKQSGRQKGPGKGSFYCDMTIRRIMGECDFDRSKLALCMRHAWCVLTVCFWEAEVLLERMKQLPARLRKGMVSWFWMGPEPEHLHAGCPTASTCVVMLAGVPPTFKVNRVVSLLVRGFDKPPSEMECAPAWFIQAFEDLEDLSFWLQRHESVLRSMEFADEVYNGDILSFPLVHVIESHSVSSESEDDERCRHPLRDISRCDVRVNHKWR